MNWLASLFVLVIIFVLLIAIIMGHLRFPKGGRIGGAAPKKSSIRTKNLIKSPRSRSEAAIIKVLETITGRSFPTVFPNWLVWEGATLELDGYNDDLKVGLEFSGPLHTKWNPQIENYPKYFERVVRDVVKKKLCQKHGVSLIVVDMSLPSVHWRNYLLSRLHDVGIVDNRPPEYINEQTAEPFRNTQIEEELGLLPGLTAALRI